MRTYGDGCGIARALDLVGERWALLVVRELLLGPKRFTDLRAGLPHIGPDVLAQRLRELERDGILTRRKLAPPAASRVYELTDRGRELEGVVLELGRWGRRAPFPPGAPALGVNSVVIALRTQFDPERAAAGEGTYALRLDDEDFTATVREGRFDIARGAAEDPDATIATDPITLAEVLWQGRPLAEAERAGSLELAGRRAARRFLGLFPAPALA